MAQTLPISLQATPVPASLQVTTLTEFMQLCAQYLTATVAADVTFFLQGSTPPVVDEGVVFFNTTTGFFMEWNNTAGAYVVVGQGIAVGDVKFNYNSGDELSLGWVLASGSRAIDSITGLTANQNTAAHVLFGAGALIQFPNITAPVSTVGGGGGGGGTLFPKIFVGYPVTP